MINEIARLAVNGLATLSEIERGTLFGEPLLGFEKEELARAVVWFGNRYQELLTRRPRHEGAKRGK